MLSYICFSNVNSEVSLPIEEMDFLCCCVFALFVFNYIGLCHVCSVPISNHVVLV